MSEEEREIRINKLEALFNALDHDNSGAIDVYEMQLLGKIIGGQDNKPTIKETAEQIQLADLDHDQQVDLGEWLEFSEPLLNIPMDEFLALIEGHIARVRASFEKGGDRYVEPAIIRTKTLPRPLASMTSSGKLVIASLITTEPSLAVIDMREADQATATLEKESSEATAKPSPTALSPTTPSGEDEKHQSKGTTVAQEKQMSMSLSTVEETDKANAPLIPPSPSGWFWGTCGQCKLPAKISCGKCKKMFCTTHGTPHLLEHVEKIGAGLETADSPDKHCFHDGGPIPRSDSRFGFVPDAMTEEALDPRLGEESTQVVMNSFDGMADKVPMTDDDRSVSALESVAKASDDKGLSLSPFTTESSPSFEVIPKSISASAKLPHPSVQKYLMRENHHSLSHLPIATTEATEGMVAMKMGRSNSCHIS